jgi:2-amino-4-hydroxy-6-hydroxymethyldihydropteridine diphosphokinase
MTAVSGERAGPTRRAFLSLGANLGERAAALGAARTALAALPGTTLLATSHIYETEPQDLADQPPFLNQVVCLETDLSALELLAAARRIEDAAGRVREARFGPRTLDVDILLFQGVESEEPELTLPHPRLWQRAFVLVPLAELWSLARGMPQVDVARLAAELAGSQAVRPYGAED